MVDVACDIWIPAAGPDVLRADNVDRLEARMVPQGANIPATDEAEVRLHERGVLVLPDFVANAGGVICGAVELAGGSWEQAANRIETTVAANTDEVLGLGAGSGSPPREAAVRIARSRVKTAMSTRRWS